MLRRTTGAALGAAMGLGLGLAYAQAPQGSGAAPSVQAKMISVSFATADLDRSVAFYTAGVGLIQTRVIENPTQKKIRMDFPGGGAGLLLIKEKGPAGDVGARIGRINLEVPDLRALEARLSSMGYRLHGGVTESKEYRVLAAVATDPDGNELELIQRLP